MQDHTDKSSMQYKEPETRLWTLRISCNKLCNESSGDTDKNRQWDI